MLLTAKGGNNLYNDFKHVTSSPLHTNVAIYGAVIILKTMFFVRKNIET